MAGLYLFVPDPCNILLLQNIEDEYIFIIYLIFKIAIINPRVALVFAFYIL